MSWYPDLPHDQAGGDGGPRSQTQMIVIHATDNTAAADAEARYAQSRPDQTSAHFYSDEGQIIQALDTSHIAYGCFPIGNSRSVQFEICGLSNQLTDASLRKVAPIVARACAEFGIPIQHVDSAGLRAGVRGIAGHIDVTYAWSEGDHTDPGSYFPWSTFIAYVENAANPPASKREDGIEMFTLPEGFGCIGSADPVDITKAIVVPVDPGPGYVAWVSMAADFGTPTVRVATQQDGAPWGVKAYTYAGQRVSLGKYTIPGQLSVIRAAKDSTEMAAYQAALTALDDSYKQFKADKIPVGISVRYLPV